MQDVVVGLLAIAVGALFAFRGYFAMRVIIPIWGAFAGFMLGAGLVDAASDDGFLRSVLGWVVGFVLALLFALVAYLYYEISVTIAMAAIGFALGTSLMAAFGVTWSWLVILVGVVAGVLLAGIAIIGDLPTVILVVLTALAGASTMVAGFMLLFGAVDTGDFESVSTTERLAEDWWWYVIYAVLAVAGVVAQVRSTEQLRISLRDQWAASGGRELHAG
jgi:uncharacterized protein DUF4203